MSKTFCEVVAERLKDKFIEIYTGDVDIVLKQGDGDSNVKSIIRGKVIEADGDCLIVNYTKDYHRVMEGDIGLQESSPLLINGYNITAVTELTKGTSIVDAFHAEHTKVKKK